MHQFIRQRVGLNKLGFTGKFCQLVICVLHIRGILLHLSLEPKLGMDAKNQRASGITRFAWPCVGRLGVLVVRRLELVHIVMHLCTAREKITHSFIDGLVQILKKMQKSARTNVKEYV